jgi:hypothetical protein
MMSIDLCKRRLEEAAEFATATTDMKTEARKLLGLVDTGHHAAIKEWAAVELRKLEAVPGTGISRPVSTRDLGALTRRMTILQAVLEELSDKAA